MPENNRFDVLIMGAGQAGIPLAHDLAKTGRRVALVEEKQLSGSCVNFGCTPTKAVIVSEVMRPLKSLHTVAPQTSVTKALEVMSREDLNQLHVVKDGHLEGIISRSHILRLLQTRAELRA